VKGPLDGRVAVVTGASMGVGRGIAVGLGEAGASVYLLGRTPATLSSAAGDVTAAGGTAFPVVCDLRDDERRLRLCRRK